MSSAAPQKCVLAYSGGLDTSVMIPWLKENHGFEVHCLAGDVGQGAGELEGLEEKALATGAASCKVVDLRHEFVTEFVWPALRALAVYEGRYLLGTSLARPVLGRAQARHALDIGAAALAHGCTGKGNDQVRFELAYQVFAPELAIVAPWRYWELKSREDAIAYAEKHSIPISASRAKIYSRDRNLWHISHEGGALEDPGTAPPDDVWTWTTDPKHAPDQAGQVRIGFEAGVPVSIDGRSTEPVTLVETLNALGAQHGVGRVDITESRLVGMKSRGVYETPGGTILYEAARSLRCLCVERDTQAMAEKLAVDYARQVYVGAWFHPLREAMDAFFSSVTRHVTGEVTVELYKGRATALAATSPASLYSADLASFSMGEAFDPADSKGFVRLFGLPGAVAAHVQGHYGANAAREQR